MLSFELKYENKMNYVQKIAYHFKFASTNLLLINLLPKIFKVFDQCHLFRVNKLIVTCFGGIYS